ncbi:ABC transporter permease [Sphingosinithalassobacter portus]|uniref:ABC transporter permease n=1 Tax=Stakelama portus TaxID=2676234 RepID=UPI000D6E7B50|nr:ABC transporter permease [Sphingosinithalassobacter portus]
MLDAVYAEALKLRRHRATWLMVWIYPIVVALILIGVLLYGAVAPAGEAGTTATAEQWINNTLIFWEIPKSAPGRFLIAGFAALVFAGEYGWNTWKLIIPARARWQLIAAKWVVVVGFVLISLIVTDLIGLIGELLGSLQGEAIPAGVTIGALLEAHIRAIGFALAPILYTVAFAGLFGVLTQSILATVILSIALVIIEGLLPLLAVLGHNYMPGISTPLIEVLPLYHVANVMAWAKGQGMTLALGPDAAIGFSFGASLAILSAWIAAAAAATQLRFARQDLN